MTEDDDVSIMGRAIDLRNYIEYAEGSIVSKTLIDKKAGTLTLFAFDSDQGLSEHSAPFDAIVQILEGEAEIVIGGDKVPASSGQMVVMPADIPHSLKAKGKFKMLLIMIRS
ncbi:MAG: cupin domain-containing protein [Halobacteriota archaeon]|nr:cupin domain-containing protein [Halobacteriota archaeon]